ncbi:DUF4261 domain-containing protein [bacterium]|nr:MAG: DUF4261 domain-containing protein [bacterium]
MGIFDSFYNNPQDALPNSDKSASLQMLFSEPLSDDIAHLQNVVRAFDSTLRAATVTGIGTGNGVDAPRSFLGQVEWGPHRVELVAFGVPMPAEVVERCVTPAAYSPEDKERARGQRAHALLYYKGSAVNMNEQFVAVALVAGALCREGALAILNEGAHTAVPAILFTSQFTFGTNISPSQFLRSMPPLYLFAGFVKYEVEGFDGLWIRTHGLEEFGLPNLATHARGHEQSEEVFDIFCNVASYMMAQGPVLEAGHTMQIGDEQFMALRELTPEEAILDDGGPLLVANFIRADEANPHIFGSERAH